MDSMLMIYRLIQVILNADCDCNCYLLLFLQQKIYQLTILYFYPINIFTDRSSADYDLQRQVIQCVSPTIILYQIRYGN